MPLENHHLFLRKCFVIWLLDWFINGFNAHNANGFCFREFYTGWLTHWGEKIAKTGADFTANALKRILSQNGSAVLYVGPSNSTSDTIK